jgi:hypothetical protein
MPFLSLKKLKVPKYNHNVDSEKNKVLQKMFKPFVPILIGCFAVDQLSIGRKIQANDEHQNSD